jgi:DNA segregation ATPase FtsK/SpoIIIE-like protein
MRLRWVGRLMKERAELVQEGEPVEGASLVMLVDGLEELAAGPHAAESLDLLDRIVRDGRELGVYLVASSRGSGLVEQLSWGARLVGRCRDAAAARAASSMQGSGAEGLLGGGDFLALLGGEAVRFQAATLSPEEVARTVALLEQVADAEQMSAEMELQAGRPSAARKGPQMVQRRSGAGPSLLR